MARTAFSAASITCLAHSSTFTVSKFPVSPSLVALPQL